MRAFSAVLALLLATGCLDLMSVELPSPIPPGEPFPVRLHVMTNSDVTAYGFLGVLAPVD